ncbi:MAG: hypothetical protein AAB242_05515 [Nitrospirota bacterium]
MSGKEGVLAAMPPENNLAAYVQSLDLETTLSLAVHSPNQLYPSSHH